MPKTKEKNEKAGQKLDTVKKDQPDENLVAAPTPLEPTAPKTATVDNDEDAPVNNGNDA